MSHEQRNKIVVVFNDETTIESAGSSSGIQDPDLREDLKWISYTLPSYIRDKGKTMTNIKRINIVLEYDTD